MESVSCFKNRVSTAKNFSISVTCVVPFCAKDNSESESQQNQGTLTEPKCLNLSTPPTPKKMIKKIIKATNPIKSLKATNPIKCLKATNPMKCLKAKGQEESSSSITSKFMKKVNKSMQSAWKKIKHEKEDDRCLWKKTILMGEKCQPLKFPGAIFYDSKGNQISEPPKSPRFSSISSSTFSPYKSSI